MDKSMSGNANEWIDLRMQAVHSAAVSPSGRENARLKSEVSSPAFNGQATAQRNRSKNRKRKRFLLLTACAVIVGTSVTVWQWAKPNPETADPSATTMQVVRRDFSSSVLATGAVKPQVGAEVRVGARISGKVERLRANIGDPVAKGQVIAELEKADLQATVAQRQAELDLAKAKLAAIESLMPQEIQKAESDYARWQASVILTEQDRKRAETLHLIKDVPGTNLPIKAIADSDYDRAVAEHETTKAQLASAGKSLGLAKTKYVEDRKQAVADLARAESTLENAKVILSYATLTAPISGVIGSVSTQEGETVAAGMNAPVFVTIIDLERLQVEAMVDEVDIGKVHPGQQATFTVDSFPAREFPGKVVAIYPKAVLMENVVYYDVVVQIQGNEDKVLRPEMTASVTIFLDAKTGVLAIPAKAIKRERGRNIVYVMQNGQPQTREIKVGWKDGTWIEVISGLKEGETILKAPPANNSTEG
jgi:multidrug efflux pump subunit AcrA (membrane-fusion protein)